MQALWQDLRYGARMLLRKPGFTLIAVITLALGIGANTAIFSVVNAVLLRPLPYPEPARLMQLGQSGTGGNDGSVGEPKFLFWREQNQTFDAMALYQPIGSGINLAGETDAEYVSALKVSQDFFRVLGVAPALGRSFTREEDQPGGDRVVIVSDGLWRQRYGADARLIGKSVTINSVSYNVVGVLPPGFQFLPSAEVFVPLRPSPRGDSDPNYGAIGRLKPGVSRAQAQADLKLVAEKYRAAFPQRMQPNESAAAIPLQQSLTADVRLLLWLLLGAVSFVLLIACANVANLQLASATARQKEIAVRKAMGASWMRIARQLVTESLLLAFIGGSAGMLLAVWGMDGLTRMIPEGALPYLGQIKLDGRVLIYTAGATMLTGLIFGLVPAFQVARLNMNQSLKEGAGRGTANGQNRLRSGLVIIEVALSLLLLIGAALMVQTFVNLRRVAPGFDPRHVLTFQISPSGASYDTTAKATDFYRRALERIKSLPGVEAAAVTSNLPLTAQFRMPFAIEGQPPRPESVQFRLVTPDYFRALKIPLTQGRAFAEGDGAGSENVALVNEAFSRQYLSNLNPLGQRLQIGGSLKHTIIGVAGDTKHFGLGTISPPMMFIPASQASDRLTLMMRRFLSVKFVVRTSGDPLLLSEAVRRQMRALDATMPVTAMRSMEQVVSDSVASERFNMSLLGLFAMLGLLLATAGIYGVISYTIAQRTQEIGIRLALGAQARDVFELIIRQGMTLTLAGVALGLITAFSLTRLIKNLLFGVSATDPMTFAAIAILIAVVALLACYVPARRATKVDPVVALRFE